MIEVPDWAAWVIGMCGGVALLWGIRMSWVSRDCDRMLKRLVWMHENADQTKFGTVGFKEAIDNNTMAMKQMTHYLVWMTKDSTGAEPPPFVPK